MPTAVAMDSVNSLLARKSFHARSTPSQLHQQGLAASIKAGSLTRSSSRACISPVGMATCSRNVAGCEQSREQALCMPRLQRAAGRRPLVATKWEPAPWKLCRTLPTYYAAEASSLEERNDVKAVTFFWLLVFYLNYRSLGV
jgi:hypothetical protein